MFLFEKSVKVPIWTYSLIKYDTEKTLFTTYMQIGILPEIQSN